MSLCQISDLQLMAMEQAEESSPEGGSPGGESPGGESPDGGVRRSLSQAQLATRLSAHALREDEEALDE